MNKQRTAAGIAVLFALALSAFAAASASATGSTAFTCVKDPSGALFGAHCLASGSGEKYKHVEIKENETTTGTATNANTAEGTTAASSTTVKGTLSGVNTEITCSEVHGEGTFENRKSGEEMYSHFEGKLHFTGCVVKAPAGKGCKIAGETVTTNQLTSTTQGETEAAKIAPKEGTIFAEVKIEGCSVGSLNNTFPTTGSFKAKANGATQTTTHADITTQATLKFGGNKAGIEGALTYKAHSKAGEDTNPIVGTPTP